MRRFLYTYATLLGSLLFLAVLAFAGMTVPYPGPTMIISGGGGNPAYGNVIYAGTVNTNTTSDVLTTTASVPAGSIIVLYHTVYSDSNPVTAVIDSGCGGTWSAGTVVTSGVGNGPLDMSYVVCTNGLASGQTITTTHAAGVDAKAYVAMSATSATHGINVDNGAAATCNAYTTTCTCPVTTTQANTVIFYANWASSTPVYTVGGSFTAVNTLTDGSGNVIYYGYRVVSATSTYDPDGSFASSDRQNQIVVAVY